MKNIYSFVSCVLFTILAMVIGAKKSIHPAVTLCKRNDPNMSECYCDNLQIMLPIIRNGVPGMNIPAMDPIIVDNIIMDLTQTQSVQLVATLFNVTMRGLSAASVAKCDFKIVESGADNHVNMKIPVLTMNSYYNAIGSFLLLKLNSTGDFNAEFTDLSVSSSWKTSKFMKKNKVHLKTSAVFDELSIKNIKIHFNNLFGNNTEINDNLNAAIAENIDVLYNEIKPIVLETIKSISVNLVNQVHSTFPFEMLFPA